MLSHFRLLWLFFDQLYWCLKSLLHKKCCVICCKENVNNWTQCFALIINCYWNDRWQLSNFVSFSCDSVGGETEQVLRITFITCEGIVIVPPAIVPRTNTRHERGLPFALTRPPITVSAFHTSRHQSCS